MVPTVRAKLPTKLDPEVTACGSGTVTFRNEYPMGEELLLLNMFLVCASVSVSELAQRSVPVPVRYWVGPAAATVPVSHWPQPDSEWHWVAARVVTSRESIC